MDDVDDYATKWKILWHSKHVELDEQQIKGIDHP